MYRDYIVSWGSLRFPPLHSNDIFLIYKQYRNKLSVKWDKTKKKHKTLRKCLCWAVWEQPSWGNETSSKLKNVWCSFVRWEWMCGKAGCCGESWGSNGQCSSCVNLISSRRGCRNQGMDECNERVNSCTKTVNCPGLAIVQLQSHLGSRHCSYQRHTLFRESLQWPESVGAYLRSLSRGGWVSV